MVISWPKQIKKTGIRTQYAHAIDIVPTIYECLGVDMPDTVKGHTQHPLEGESFAKSLHDETATGRGTQFYSMLGTRGIYHDGWKAATVTPATPDAWGDFANQRWELFNTQTDPSECHDLAEQRPDKLAELTALWWAEAGKYPPAGATSPRLVCRTWSRDLARPCVRARSPVAASSSPSLLVAGASCVAHPARSDYFDCRAKCWLSHMPRTPVYRLWVVSGDGAIFVFMRGVSAMVARFLQDRRWISGGRGDVACSDWPRGARAAHSHELHPVLR